MPRFARLLPSLVLAGVLLLAGRRLALQAAPSLTNVCGTISTNQTWTPAGSPYVVCAGHATVASGVTLTLQPGVVVQVANDSQLTVRGTLTAIGSPEQPITFTAAVASPGSWRGVVMESLVVTPAQMTLEHVTFEYGGLNTSTGAQIQAYNGTLTVTDSLLRDGAGAGLYAAGNAHVSVHDTQFLDHGHQAMILSQPENGVDLGGLSASGNSRDVVQMNSTTYFDDEQLWPNAGIPYVINGLLGTFEGGSLTIAPGSELRFTSIGRLYIRGDLKAIGLPGEPITLTGDVATPGYWDGLWLYGLTRPATAQLDHVTVEYGGKGISSGANILVDYGHLIAHHIVVRHSLFDGVRFGSNGRGSVLNSQIFSNTIYGVNNTVSARAVLAANNWWGHPSGPTPDLAACGANQGDRVTTGVIFRPVLTSTLMTAPFPLSDAPYITLTPRRWFAPADGITRVYFDITLRDGDGRPLPGRVVNVSSTLGVATDGGITDASGHTLAYLVSNNPGDAEVTASLDPIGACEDALSPTSKVTFTPPVDVTELFPDSPASYFDGNITIAPMPVVAGRLTYITAKLTNPLTVPITVDIAFGYVQASIGLEFGPISDQIGQVIPANSSRTFDATFLPPFPGHYCVEVTYAITSIGAAGLQQPMAGGQGRRQLNLNVQQGSTGSSDKDGILDRTGKALDFMSNFIGNAFDTDPFAIPLELTNRLIIMQLSAATIIGNALMGDPPRADYQQLDGPHPLVPAPVQPGGGITPERAEALNDLAEAQADVNAAGLAATIALDRAGGASEANDAHWASIQQAAVLEYTRVMGTALITAAAAIDDVISVGASEGVTQVVISTSEVISAQQQLAVGFTPQHVAEAASVGITEDQLEAWRQRILAARPEDLAGDMIPRLRLVRDRYLELAEVLLHPVAFRPGHGVTGGAGQQSLAAGAASGNSMVQLSNTTATFVLGNPLTTTAGIDVRARRIDLPADWFVTVTPAQVTLAPGEQVTVTVEIGAGSPLPQGSQPTVAVEGYAGSQLLGGVVVQVLAPNYYFFDGFLRVYLPLVQR